MKRSLEPEARQNRIVSTIRRVGLIRLVIVIPMAVIGCTLSFMLTVSGLTRFGDPQVALAFVPNEATALAARADQLYLAQPQNPPADARNLAVASLRNQAMNPKALRLLGFIADSAGKNDEAFRLISLAARLSRREAGAQIWLIETDSRRGDLVQTLRHYDILLRTNPESRDLLFSRLLAAIDDAEIRRAFVPYVRSNRGWVADFIFYAMKEGQNLPALVDLVAESAPLANTETVANQERALLARLVESKDFTSARRLFMLMSGASEDRLQQASFDANDRDGRFGAMGWQIHDDSEAGGAFGTSGTNGGQSLSLYVNAATTRTIASKLLYLAPGGYRLNSQSSAIDRKAGGSVQWQMRCADGGDPKPFWMERMDESRFAADVLVPARCPVQILELVATGGAGQTGFEAVITDVKLLPSR